MRIRGGDVAEGTIETGDPVAVLLDAQALVVTERRLDDGEQFDRQMQPALPFEVAAERVRRRMVHVRQRRVRRLLRLADRLLRDHAAQLAKLRFSARHHAQALLAGSDGATQIAEERELQDAQIRDDALGRRAAQGIADQLAGVAILPHPLRDGDRFDLRQQDGRSGVSGSVAHGAHHQLIRAPRTEWDLPSALAGSRCRRSPACSVEVAACATRPYSEPCCDKKPFTTEARRHAAKPEHGG